MLLLLQSQQVKQLGRSDVVLFSFVRGKPVFSGKNRWKQIADLESNLGIAMTALQTLQYLSFKSINQSYLLIYLVFLSFYL